MQIEKLASVGYWSEAEGRAAVVAWRASGLTRATFARQHGVATRRLAYWEQRISPSTATRSAIMLAPVTVIASPARDSEIALELRSGHVVRLRGVVDEDQLARVIRAAERAGC